MTEISSLSWRRGEERRGIKKKKKHDKKEAQFCGAGEEASCGFTALESRQLHRGAERASELCGCSSGETESGCT